MRFFETFKDNSIEVLVMQNVKKMVINMVRAANATE